MPDSEELSNMTGFRVNRRGGTATNSGVNYESYMYLLVLIRLLTDKRIKEFYIAQNVDDVGAFDDIVVRVKFHSFEEDAIIQKLFLVQLKHRDSRSVTLAALTTTTGRGDLRLQKYFDGYKLLLNKIGKFEDKILNECRMEEMTMIIYTNAHCPIGDNNCPGESLCRQLLETGEKSSNVFSFNSSEKYETFHQEMIRNRNPISEEKDGVNFLKRMVFFSNQSSVLNLQEKLKNELKNYFINDKVHLDHVLYNSMKFVYRNSSFWMSLNSGVLSNVVFNYQGVPVKLNDMKTIWGNNQVYSKIIVKHICQDENGYVCIGKTLRATDPYYIKRFVLQTTEELFITRDSNKVQVELEDIFNRLNNSMLNEPLVLICGSPGMGKSIFFTHQAMLAKKMNAYKYIIREDLIRFSEYLNNLNVNGSHIDLTENFLMKIAGIVPNTIEYEIFQICLRSNQMMVIFLDGVDEISPFYYEKVLIIIKTIRREFNVQLWISTRPILQRKMEKDIGLISWNLQKFSMNDTHTFLKKYCAVNEVELNGIAENLCGIPMFCKILGDIINSNVIKGSDANLSTITNKAQLYDNFIDVMYERYHKEKELVDINTAAARSKMAKLKRMTLSEYEDAALLEVFPETELTELEYNLDSNCKDLINEISHKNEKMGFIIYNIEKKPNFIHRSVAEYFCGRWFAGNKDCFKRYVKKYNHLPMEVDYFMSAKLDNLDSIFKTVLFEQNKSKVLDALKNDSTNFNKMDALGRTLLHYADISKNEYALRYILFNGFILTEEFVKHCKFNNNESKYVFNSYLLFHWLESNLIKSSKLKSLFYIILFRDEFKENVYYLLLKYSKNCPLHVAILNKNKSNINQLLDQDINSRNNLGLTSLHMAAIAEDLDTILLLAGNGAKYTRDNIFSVYPHQISKCYYITADMIIKQLKIYYNEFMIEDILINEIRSQNYDSQNLPLQHSFQNDDLSQINLNNLKNLLDLQKIDPRGRTILHVAATRNDINEFCSKIFDIKPFQYTKDFDGFYPHDYVNDKCRDEFKIYVLRNILESLSIDDRTIFGEDIVKLLYVF